MLTSKHFNIKTGKRVPLFSLRMRSKSRKSYSLPITNYSLNKGFTLIELLLVIAIIGIIAATLVMMLASQRERARLAAFKEQMGGLVSIGATCVDSGGTLKSARDDEILAPICDPAGSYGNHLPGSARRQCDGSGGAYEVRANPNFEVGSSQIFRGMCVMDDGTECTADCSLEGCVFSDECN